MKENQKGTLSPKEATIFLIAELNKSGKHEEAAHLVEKLREEEGSFRHVSEIKKEKTNNGNGGDLNGS